MQNSHEKKERFSSDGYGPSLHHMSSRLSETLTVCSLRVPPPVMTGTVTFTPENITFKQQLNRPTDTKKAKAYSTTAAQCLQNVRRNKSFTMLYSQHADGTDEVQLTIPYSLIGNLPVLKDLWDSTAPALHEEPEEPASGEAQEPASEEPANSSQEVDRTDEAASSTTAVDHVHLTREHSVPFTPPASLWALASVLLILEGRLNFWHWLGSVDGDPRLAADTLAVRCSRSLFDWTKSCE